MRPLALPLLAVLACTAPLGIDDVLPRFVGERAVHGVADASGLLTCAGPRLVGPALEPTFGLVFAVPLVDEPVATFGEQLTTADVRALRDGTWAITGSRAGRFEARIELGFVVDDRDVVLRHAFRCEEA